MKGWERNMGEMREGDKVTKGIMDRNNDVGELRCERKEFTLILNGSL
jgi:hypothetical protein